jgi:hypothetical protein
MHCTRFLKLFGLIDEACEGIQLNLVVAATVQLATGLLYIYFPLSIRAVVQQRQVRDFNTTCNEYYEFDFFDPDADSSPLLLTDTGMNVGNTKTLTANVTSRDMISVY